MFSEKILKPMSSWKDKESAARLFLVSGWIGCVRIVNGSLSTRIRRHGYV